MDKQLIIRKAIGRAFSILLLACTTLSGFAPPALALEDPEGRDVVGALALLDKFKHREAITLINKAFPKYKLPCDSDFQSMVHYLAKLTVDKELDAIIKKAGYQRQSFSIRGIAFATLGDLDAAMKDFNSALVICPRSATIICNKGQVFLKQGKLNEALLEAQKALKIDHNLAEAHKLLGNIYKAQKLYKKSSEEFSSHRALAERKLGKDTHFYTTLVLDAAIVQNPKNAHLYRARGRSRRLDDPEGAKADYKKAIQLDRSYASAYAGLSKVYRQGRELKLAKSAIETAIKLDPNVAQYWIDKGYVYSNLNQFEKTLQCFDRAVKIEPANLYVRQIRAEAQRINKNIAGAMSECNYILKLEPDNAPALITRANCLRLMRKFNAAIADATRAIELEPKNADAYYCRSECYFRLDQMELAQADEDRFRKLRPETQAHQESQAEAESIADELESAAAKDLGVAKHALPIGGNHK